MIARSYEEARKMAIPPKFYLDILEDTASTKTELKKLRNKALATLEELSNKNGKKFFYVAKVVDVNSAQYYKTTPTDIMYINMDKYIVGEGHEKNKLRAAQTFLDIADQDLATLKLRAMIKDASYYKIIGTKSDGYIYHLATSSVLGKNTAEVLEYLKNPLNDQILVDTSKEVEKYWNK
jgi:hypothetical protein